MSAFRWTATVRTGSRDRMIGTAPGEKFADAQAFADFLRGGYPNAVITVTRFDGVERIETKHYPKQEAAA